MESVDEAMEAMAAKLAMACCKAGLTESAGTDSGGNTASSQNRAQIVEALS